MGTRRPGTAGAPTQADLSGFGADVRSALHRLFFALLPDAAVGARIAAVAEHLRADKRIRAKWIDPAKYHITLVFLGDFPELRPGFVERIVAAAARAQGPAFQLILDRVTSFRGRSPPCVLRCAAIPDELGSLRQSVLVAVAGTVRAEEPARFTPHATLAYAQTVLPAPIAIDPIVWRVGEFALVHNLIGRGEYRVLGRWPLHAGN